jgi:hypothetical protein
MSAFRTAGGRWRLPGRGPAVVAACALAGAGLAGGAVLAVAGPAAAPPAVTATIPVGTAPFGVAVGALAGAVYVANNGSNNVSVITFTACATTITGTYSGSLTIGPGTTCVEPGAVITGSVTITADAEPSTPSASLDRR